MSLQIIVPFRDFFKIHIHLGVKQITSLEHFKSDANRNLTNS